METPSNFDMSGKIGLTLCLPLSPLFDALNEVGKLQQIRHAKGASTICKDHRGIRRNNTHPVCWQPPHWVSGIVKGSPIYSPIVPTSYNPHLLPTQPITPLHSPNN